MFLLGVCLAVLAAAEPITLANDAVQIRLGFPEEGRPGITAVSWPDSDKPLLASHTGAAEDAPLSLLPSQTGPAAWKESEDEFFRRAECERPLANETTLAYVVELARHGTLMRLHFRMTNHGAKPCSVESFPILNARWDVPGLRSIRGWRALQFTPVEEPFTSDNKLTWNSRIHSSDTRDNKSGMNPYWAVETDAGHLYFGLEWCGGWSAEIAGGHDVLDLKVLLPQQETQLTLAPGESIDGPAMLITAVRETDEAEARANWMRQRAALAAQLYPGPAPSYPWVYNNWYTTRFDVDAAFVKRQIENIAPYPFDSFVVDAGWYECCGTWTPDPAKFAQGELESMLRSVKPKGILPGIWTCPQFVRAPKDNLPPEVDQPPTFEKFINGYLLDLAGTGFSKTLVDHVAALRERFDIQWWKYDQILFSAHTRAGIMRNVIAFQDALKAVRAKNPDLVIENCQSGGRMTNELTVLATQTQWLKDGGNTGLQHARDNISVTLGAMEFIFPWASNRWTNNPDQIAPADDELLRYYCRSAMAGTWGVVADLAKISEHQRAIILRECTNYRRLNELKPGYLYDIVQPSAGAKAISVTFYNRAMDKAAAIIYRWDGEEAFDYPLHLRLDPAKPWHYEDVDAHQTTQEPTVHFPAARRSAVVFID